MSVLRSIAMATAGVTFSAGVALAENISIPLDQAKRLKLPDGATSVVIGNPSVADITFENESTVFVFGKGTGVTNMVLLNESGEAVADHTIAVVGARVGFVTLNRGVGQFTYACMGRCESALMVGDDAGYFGAAFDQTKSKSELAIEAAAASGGNE